MEVREVDPEPSEAILELLRLGLGPAAIPRSEEYWSWKHVDNPFGRSYCLVAADGDQLAGLRVFLRWTLRCGHREVAAVRAVDTVTHPRWRGQGLFTRLTRTLLERVAERGVSFVFNTPNGLSRPGYLKMGWDDVRRIPVLVRSRRPYRLLFASRRPHPREGDAIELEGLDRVESFLAAEGTPELIERLRWKEPRFHTARSLEYLRWRYHHNPAAQYYALAQQDGDDAAVILFRAKWRRGLRELSLAELLVGATSGSRRLARLCLSQLARRRDVDYLVATAAKGTPERATLQSARFLPLPRVGPHFTVRDLDRIQPSPVRWASWRLNLGDLEIF